MVMVFHFMPSLPDGSALYARISEVAGLGWVGVDLFFVLSGFLITGILLDTKDSVHFFRRFYTRRALRIFPLYFALLAAVIFVIPFVGLRSETSALAIKYQGWLWLYGANILVVVRRSMCLGHLNHLWSLAVEEHFYLVWPLVVYWCKPRTLLSVCVACIAAALFTRLACFALSFEFYIQSAYLFTLCRVDSLCVGAILATIVREEGTQFLRRLWTELSVVSAAILFAVFNLQHGAYRGHWFWGVPGYTLIAVVFGGAVVAALPSTSGSFSRVFRTICSTRGLRMLGKYSYGLYLFHYLLLQPITRTVTPSFFMRMHLGALPAVICCLVVWVAMCLLPAIASWHLFERWFLLLKDPLAPGQDPATCTSPGLIPI